MPSFLVYWDISVTNPTDDITLSLHASRITLSLDVKTQFFDAGQMP